MEKLNSMDSPLRRDDGEHKLRIEAKRTMDKSTIQEMQRDIKQLELPSLNKNGPKGELADSSEHASPVNTNASMREGEPRKTSYHLKNVYLTLNKIGPNGSGVEKHRSKPNKIQKEKSNHYGPYKVSNISIRASKATEMDKFKHKPLLDIRHIDSGDFGFTVDSAAAREMGRHIFGLEDNRSLQVSKEHYSKKSIAEKKNIRVTQLMNKSNLNYKLQGGDCQGAKLMS